MPKLAKTTISNKYKDGKSPANSRSWSRTSTEDFEVLLVLLLLRNIALHNVRLYVGALLVGALWRFSLLRAISDGKGRLVGQSRRKTRVPCRHFVSNMYYSRLKSYKESLYMGESGGLGRMKRGGGQRYVLAFVHRENGIGSTVSNYIY